MILNFFSLRFYVSPHRSYFHYHSNTNYLLFNFFVKLRRFSILQFLQMLTSLGSLTTQQCISLAKTSLIGITAICTTFVTIKALFSPTPILSLDWDEDDEEEIIDYTATASDK